MIPINENVLVVVLRDQTKEVYYEVDTRKDLQYARVEAVSEGSKLDIGAKIVFNPRNLHKIIVDGDLKGILHETQIIAII